jgi:hypothetical protein
MADKSKSNDASAQFAKMQRAQDAKKATSDYELAATAVRAKTERLRALRLARDAAAPVATPAKPKSKKKAASGNLSDWLDGEAKAGRNR